MSPRLVLNTHVAIRWLVDARRLSRAQMRALEAAVQRTEPLALSAITLLEIAILFGDGKLKLKTGLGEFFDDLEANPVFRLLPLTYEIAQDVGALGPLKDLA